eukprot:TRINITY_DN1763_c0_g2_i1.p1 TRINITY_DN1763_c0_g2~~TRINITY_DN1763_c0_g2_i1.p1  ORF type:complete len:959 (-),score=153.88 TRINITY_DN1763_c0_g2_i1:193-3036(-)
MEKRDVLRYSVTEVEKSVDKNQCFSIVSTIEEIFVNKTSCKSIVEVDDMWEKQTEGKKPYAAIQAKDRKGKIFKFNLFTKHHNLIVKAFQMKGLNVQIINLKNTDFRGTFYPSPSDSTDFLPYDAGVHKEDVDSDSEDDKVVVKVERQLRKIEYKGEIEKTRVKFNNQDKAIITTIFISDDRGKLTADVKYICEQSSRALRMLNQNKRLTYLVRLTFDMSHQRYWRTTVQDIMTNGFIIKDTEYEPLGYSDGMMRERKAWFWQKNMNCSAEQFRRELGYFEHMWKNPTKCAARFGQCWTKSTKVVDLLERNIIIIQDDIIHQGDKYYCFTDGIGQISIDLAASLSHKLGKINQSELENNQMWIYKIHEGKIPSAFQIRIAGIKGMVAINPKLKGEVLAIRPSMIKFQSNSLSLEIVNYSSPRIGYLNSQFIQDLRALGIHDNVFLGLLRGKMDHISNLTINDIKIAGEVDNDINNMIFANLSDEYLVRNYLKKTKKRKLLQLQSKFQIPVPRSRMAYGVIDESGLLKYGQCQFRYTTSDSGTITHHGKLMVLRSPTLLAEDCRILEAVDIDDKFLNLQVNVIVFPKDGPRPHADEISGGDLDGDKYFVCMEKALIPEEDNILDPQEYSSYNPKDNNNFLAPVDIEQNKLGWPDHVQSAMARAFVDYWDLDLGGISNAHTALSDQSKDGVKDPKAKNLALLFYKVLDKPKTGDDIDASEYDDLKKKLKYPHWMGLFKDKSYHSTSVFGLLYDEIERMLMKLKQEEISETYTVNPDLLPQKDLLVKLTRYVKSSEKKKPQGTVPADKEIKIYEQLVELKEYYSKKFAQILKQYKGEIIDKKALIYINDEEYASEQAYHIKKLQKDVIQQYENILAEHNERIIWAPVCYFITYEVPKYSKEKPTGKSFPWVLNQYLITYKYTFTNEKGASYIDKRMMPYVQLIGYHNHAV